MDDKPFTVITNDGKEFKIPAKIKEISAFFSEWDWE